MILCHSHPELYGNWGDKTRSRICRKIEYWKKHQGSWSADLSRLGLTAKPGKATLTEREDCKPSGAGVIRSEPPLSISFSSDSHPEPPTEAIPEPSIHRTEAIPSKGLRLLPPVSSTSSVAGASVVHSAPGSFPVTLTFAADKKMSMAEGASKFTSFVVFQFVLRNVLTSNIILF